MNFTRTKTSAQKVLLFFLLMNFAHIAFSQTSGVSQKDSTKKSTQLSGLVTVTNNGISVIPTFTLGKPATLFDFVVRKNRFSFEPQIRFAIQDAKPWSFVFWLRYKLIQTDKFKMGMGVHPSFVFSTTPLSANGITKDYITIRRFFAGELTPNYFLSKNVSVGIYYLYSRGLADATRNTNFIALGSNFSNIKLSNDFFMKFAPQIYYLKLDANDGYYATSTFTLAKKNFPFAISSTVNKKIQSNIVSDDFVWNVSLSYAY